MVLKFRKKPVVVEAMQIPSPGPDFCANGEEFVRWLDDGGCKYGIHPDATVYIITIEGEMKARPGDWVIKGVRGEFYACKKDIFDETYEPAEWV